MTKLKPSSLYLLFRWVHSQYCLSKQFCRQHTGHFALSYYIHKSGRTSTSFTLGLTPPTTLLQFHKREISNDVSVTSHRPLKHIIYIRGKGTVSWGRMTKPTIILQSPWLNGKFITVAQGLAVKVTTTSSSLTLLPSVGKLRRNIYYTQKTSKSFYDARGLYETCFDAYS